MRDVTKITWDWRNTAGDKTAGATALRRPALVQASVLVVVGVLVAVGLGHAVVARVVWSLAGVFLLLGLFWPAGYRPMHAFGQKLGQWVGMILLYILLAPFYLLFFGLVSVGLKWRRRDPMHRTYHDQQWTYWIARREKQPDENFADQFLREDKNARAEQRPVGTSTRTREGGAA